MPASTMSSWTTDARCEQQMRAAVRHVQRSTALVPSALCVMVTPCQASGVLALCTRMWIGSLSRSRVTSKMPIPERRTRSKACSKATPAS
jgi:hypothetical protein